MALLRDREGNLLAESDATHGHKHRVQVGLPVEFHSNGASAGCYFEIVVRPAARQGFASGPLG